VEASIVLPALDRHGDCDRIEHQTDLLGLAPFAPEAAAPGGSCAEESPIAFSCEVVVKSTSEEAHIFLLSAAKDRRLPFLSLTSK
jgi:hypothetical protein